MLFNAVPALLSLALAGLAAAAPAVAAPATVNCNIVGVHIPGRSPPSPNRVDIDITFAIHESLWKLSTWDGRDPEGGVWGDYVTHTVLSDGRLDVKAVGYYVAEITIEETKAHLESLAGTTLASGNFAAFAVHEIACVIVGA